MDDLPAAELSATRLEEEFRSMRSMFYLALVSMIILEASLCLFLLRELTLVRRQTRELNVFVNDYNQNSVPVMKDFQTKLEEFSKRNPDFLPILRHYGLGGDTNAPSGSGPVITPATNSMTK